MCGAYACGNYPQQRFVGLAVALGLVHERFDYECPEWPHWLKDIPHKFNNWGHPPHGQPSINLLTDFGVVENRPCDYDGYCYGYCYCDDTPWDNNKTRTIEEFVVVELGQIRLVCCCCFCCGWMWGVCILAKVLSTCLVWVWYNSKNPIAVRVTVRMTIAMIIP